MSEPGPPPDQPPIDPPLHGAGPGARMRPRERDVAWAAVTLVIAAVLFWGAVGEMYLLVAERSWPAARSAAFFALLAGTFGRWILMGAWRRTIWGAPPGGVREAVEPRYRRLLRRD